MLSAAISMFMGTLSAWAADESVATVDVKGGLGIIHTVIDGDQETVFKDGANHIDFYGDQPVEVKFKFVPNVNPSVEVDGAAAQITDNECTVSVNPGAQVNVSTDIVTDANALNLLIDDATPLEYFQLDRKNRSVESGFQTIELQEGRTRVDLQILPFRGKLVYVRKNDTPQEISLGNQGYYQFQVQPGDCVLIVTNDGDEPEEPFVVTDPDGEFYLEIEDASTINAMYSGVKIPLTNGINTIPFAYGNFFEINPVEGYTIARVTRDGVDQQLGSTGYSEYLSDADPENDPNGVKYVVYTERGGSQEQDMATINVTGAEFIDSAFNDSLDYFDLTEGENLIKLSNSRGMTLFVEFKPNVRFEATINGEPVNCGTYSCELNLTPGCVATISATDNSSSVDGIASTAQSFTVYNLQGIRLMDQVSADTLRTLAPGVYIINGHKVSVK